MKECRILESQENLAYINEWISAMLDDFEGRPNERIFFHK